MNTTDTQYRDDYQKLVSANAKPEIINAYHAAALHLIHAREQKTKVRVLKLTHEQMESPSSPMNPCTN